MKELHELKLSPRGRTIEQARRVVAEQSHHDGPALDEAFADFTPPPRRTDSQHNAVSAETWNPQEAAHQIASQLQQLEQQRRQLAQLLESLEKAE